MAEKRELSKDYWSAKALIPEWVEVGRFDKLWSGCEGQGAVLINIGPGPADNPTRLKVDHAEETTQRIRVIWMEPVPGDVPYHVGIYEGWKRLGITDVVAREAWVDKTAIKRLVAIPAGTEVVNVELRIDWEGRTVTARVLG